MWCPDARSPKGTDDAGDDRGREYAECDGAVGRFEFADLVNGNLPDGEDTADDSEPARQPGCRPCVDLDERYHQLATCCRVANGGGGHRDSENIHVTDVAQWQHQVRALPDHGVLAGGAVTDNMPSTLASTALFLDCLAIWCSVQRRSPRPAPQSIERKRPARPGLRRDLFAVGTMRCPRSPKGAIRPRRRQRVSGVRLGEAFVVNRNGVPEANLTPARRRR
jgi:hypothetical protein